MDKKHQEKFIWNRIFISIIFLWISIFYFYFLKPNALFIQRRSFLFELILIAGGGFIGIAIRALAHIGDEGEKSKKTLTQLWVVYLFLYPTIVIFLAPLVYYFFFSEVRTPFVFIFYLAQVSAGFLIGMGGYGILNKLTDKATKIP